MMVTFCTSQPPRPANRAPKLNKPAAPVFLMPAEPYEVPEEAGDSQDAFFKVSVLEEELRVMNPDLGAIQVGAASWVHGER